MTRDMYGNVVNVSDMDQIESL